MELGPSVLENISLAGESVHLSDKLFSSLVSSACRGILVDEHRNKIQDHPAFKDTDKAILKAAYSGIVTLILESAKHDCDEGNVRSVLEECKYTDDRTKVFCNLFLPQKPQIQLLLGKIGSSFPHIVDVDWRLDYHIKSDQLEKVNAAMYLISLKTEVPGESELQEVQFSCSLEQLQDLVGKLRDAMKCMDKIAQV